MTTQHIKDFFNDIFNTARFAVLMAWDVNRFLKEEKANESLCLEL